MKLDQITFQRPVHVSGNFIGVNITDGIIEHLRAHDVEKAECGVHFSDLLEIWSE